MLNEMKAEGRDIVVCGDWNIAHQNIDLKNWKGNQKNSGFLPEERAWIGKVIAEFGWTDMWRTLYPESPATLGGATAVRPMPKTWAGASITKWSRPVWPPKPWPRICIKKKNFPTTRLWWWNMIIRFE